MIKYFNINRDGISLSIGKRRKEVELSDNHRHWHYELYYMAVGHAKFFIDNEIIAINQGEIMIVREGVIHKTVYEAGVYTERLLICFTTEFLGESMAEIIKELGERKLITFAPHICLEVEELFNILKRENENEEEYRIENAYHTLCHLLILLYRQKNVKTPKKLTSNEQIIQKAAKYIAENYNSEITLYTLSQMFAMSQSYFSKTFKLHTGFGVIEYITAIRISKAEYLLKTTSKSITSIATECGFSDSNYFASIFKKKNGITPKKYATLSKKEL